MHILNESELLILFSYFLREAAKKFFIGPATKALHTPPSLQLCDHIFFGFFLLEL